MNQRLQHLYLGQHIMSTDAQARFAESAPSGCDMCFEPFVPLPKGVF
jgi:hypothetical protein